MKNHKGFAIIEGLLILVIVGILGGTGWYVYNAHNKTTDSYTNADTANSSVAKYPKKQATQAVLKIPDGFVETKIDKLGLSFAYPKEWGQLDETKFSTSTIFQAFFSATKIATSNSGEYSINLYGNSGKQDFTIGGRGGALWDCVGF